MSLIEITGKFIRGPALSVKLAKAVIDTIQPSPGDYIVQWEISPNRSTTLTKLLASNLPSNSELIVVGLNVKLAKSLKLEFPKIQVYLGEQSGIPNLFETLPPHTKIISPISSRTLNLKIRAKTIEMLIAFISENSLRTLVQYSYWPTPPFDVPDQLIWKLRKVLIPNVPPASIWELRHRGTGWTKYTQNLRTNSLSQESL